MEVIYRTDRCLGLEEFNDILVRSTLADRRPVDDPDRLSEMLSAYTLIVTAWSGPLLVGVSTAWTDFAYTCYLADLAVDRQHQHQGIGRRLVALTGEAAGKRTNLILLAAPKAAAYYPKIGMHRFIDCFVKCREE